MRCVTLQISAVRRDLVLPKIGEKDRKTEKSVQFSPENRRKIQGKTLKIGSLFTLPLGFLLIFRGCDDFLTPFFSYIILFSFFLFFFPLMIKEKKKVPSVKDSNLTHTSCKNHADFSAIFTSFSPFFTSKLSRFFRFFNQVSRFLYHHYLFTLCFWERGRKKSHHANLSFQHLSLVKYEPIFSQFLQEKYRFLQ